MSDLEQFFESLDDLSVHQLEQLNRLLEAVRRYLPADVPAARRRATISRAVIRLRDGISDAELDELIGEFKRAS
jgi:hypothetical protein